MRKTALIYGSGGQDGMYLTRLLQESSYEVVGLDRKTAKLNNYNLHVFDEVCKLIIDIRPLFVFHLAANSTTKIDAVLENHETICTGTINILEAIRLYSPQTKVFISGSGLQFENKGVPIHESNPFHAGSVYAVSRIHSSFAARYYRSLGIKVYVGYFFNHDSPYRTERHINKKISETARRISLGSKEKLIIGDLQTIKEFGFSKDIVEGIFQLVNQDAVFESVIGTGVGYSIKEWINICFSYFNLNWEDYTETFPGFIPEYSMLVSEPSTLFTLGWRHKTTIQALAQLMIQG